MNLKKTIIYIVTAVLTFIIIFCSLLLWEKYKANKMVKDFDKAFASSEKHMVLYARKSCYYCQMLKPVLKNIATDYDLDYLDIDADNLSSKQKQHIIDKLGIEGSTPATAIVQNGKVLAVHVGYLDGKEYVEFLKENGMLPEDAIYNQEKNLNQIGYDEFKTLENGILVLGMNGNQACIDLRLNLNNIANGKKTKINYINLSLTTLDEFNDIVNDLEYMNVNNKLNIDEDGGLPIPMVIIIEDSKIKDAFYEEDKNKLKQKLNKYMK